MILTVTPNSALDLTLCLDEFKTDRVVRAAQTTLSVAGKPVDASYVLGEMGVSSLATGFAAGVFGEKLCRLLRNKGVVTDFVWVDGETRINPILLDRRDGTATTLTSNSLRVSQGDVDRFFLKLEAHLPGVDCMITGGSLPRGLSPGLYSRLLRRARRMGVSVIFDGSGENLRAALEEQPVLIKPNQTELSELLGSKIRDVTDALEASVQVRESMGVGVVATLGEQGAVAAFAEGLYRLMPMVVREVISPAGAGDAILAGLSLALATGSPLVQGLILGAAAAAAVLITPGTADCRRSDILAFLPQVEVVPVGRG